MFQVNQNRIHGMAVSTTRAETASEDEKKSEKKKRRTINVEKLN
jgi:hypothetical protein